METKCADRSLRILETVKKSMLPRKDKRAAGELEGAKAPLEIGL